MKRSIIIAIILTFSLNSAFSQKQAFVHVFEEHTYPAEAYTTIAQKKYTWTFNGKEIKYKTGKYAIPINSGDQFDTIKFQAISEKQDPIRGISKNDTAIKVILCKFKENHNYKLGQLLAGHFELYALDTFETQTCITLKVRNNKSKDTLYIYNSYPQRKVFSDTTLTILNKNERMEQSFLQHFELSKLDREIWFDESKPGIHNDDIVDFYFNFLQAENLEIEFDASANKYKLWLRK
ncbi:MAG: hypothetical protein ACXVPU_09105 [Bacteroidia bacterium]